PGLVRGERNVGERVPHRAQRRLGPPVPAREPEVPVINVGAGTVPFVGPRIDEGAGATRGERGTDLPVQDSRLYRFAVPPAVEPDLAHEERALAGQRVQPG